MVAGWGLVLAARKMGLLQVPAVTIDDLDEAKLRLLRLALNRLGEDSSWDLDALDGAGARAGSIEFILTMPRAGVPPCRTEE